MDHLEALNAILLAAENAPELNMCNYDHDQVADLNAAMIDIYQIAMAALGKTPISQLG